jgi:hypothetical protein
VKASRDRGDCLVRAVQLQSLSEQPPWLVSRRFDFWLASGGASIGVLASVAIILLHGDRELDWLDSLLSEFHLGATYGAITRRRLWHDRPVDVVAIPLLILALTYGLWLADQTVLLASIAMYAGLWHRGRQSFGVARFYQRQLGGPASRAHDLWFRGAIYLPMLAAMLAYSHLAPHDYEGKPYLALNVRAEVATAVGTAAALCGIGYLFWTGSRWRSGPVRGAAQKSGEIVHPGERWVVLAHTVAFGSGYLLGTVNASYMLVLAVYHEVQYLYFAYAVARRSDRSPGMSHAGVDQATELLASRASALHGGASATELKHMSAFFVWPVIGFVGAVAGGWSELEWLAPLGVGGLFCHYWLDGRIWTGGPRG